MGHPVEVLESQDMFCVQITILLLYVVQKKICPNTRGGTKSEYSIRQSTNIEILQIYLKILEKLFVFGKKKYIE